MDDEGAEGGQIGRDGSEEEDDRPFFNHAKTKERTTAESNRAQENIYPIER